VFKRYVKRALPYVAGLGILLTSNIYAQDTSGDRIAKVVVPAPRVVESAPEEKPDRLTSRLLGGDIIGNKYSPLVDLMNDTTPDEYELADYRIGPTSDRYEVSVPFFGTLVSIPTGQLRHDFKENLKLVAVDRELLARNSYRGKAYRKQVDEQYEEVIKDAGEMALRRWGADIAPGVVNALEEGLVPTILTLGLNKVIVNKFDLYGEAIDSGKKYRGIDESDDDGHTSGYDRRRFDSGISLGGNPTNPSAKVRVKARFGMELNLKGEYELEDGFSAEVEVPVYTKRTSDGFVDVILYGEHKDEDDGSSVGFKVSMPIEAAPRAVGLPFIFVAEKVGGIFSKKK